MQEHFTEEARDANIQRAFQDMGGWTGVETKAVTLEQLDARYNKIKAGIIKFLEAGDMSDVPVEFLYAYDLKGTLVFNRGKNLLCANVDMIKLYSTYKLLRKFLINDPITNVNRVKVDSIPGRFANALSYGSEENISSYKPWSTRTPNSPLYMSDIVTEEGEVHFSHPIRRDNSVDGEPFKISVLLLDDYEFENIKEFQREMRRYDLVRLPIIDLTTPYRKNFDPNEPCGETLLFKFAKKQNFNRVQRQGEIAKYCAEKLEALSEEVLKRAPTQEETQIRLQQQLEEIDRMQG